MFRLTRFFFLTNAIAVAAVSALVVFHRHNEIARVIEFAERRNVELARSMANTIWPRFFLFVKSASVMDPEALRSGTDAREIRAAIRAVSAGLPILKIKIYNLDGLTVFSTDPAEIGENRRSNPGFVAAARQGRTASKLTYRDTLSSFERTIQDRDLVESYLPIHGETGLVQGVFELYSDVTELLGGIQRATLNLVVGFLIMFVLLYGLLFAVVRRADGTIKRQYGDIRDKNEALEREIAERVRTEQALQQAHDELERRVEERTRELTEEILQRKRVEDEARHHRDELARYGRISILGEMATSLSHELNQPLTVISGCAQFCRSALRSGEGSPEKLREALEQVSEQAERANGIVRRIRGFVRKEEEAREEIDVNEAVLGVADLLRSDAREHGVELDLRLADPLPRVFADRIQIQQVVLNLAHNGIEAIAESGHDGGRLTISTTKDQGGSIEMSVHDEGIGVPPDALKRIFDPFFTTKAGGLGMGLSICHSIVEAHGGRLWATSESAAGTAFHVTIPVSEQ